MNIEVFLRQATDKLTQAGISSARLDCLLLLEDATNKDRAWLLAHPEHPLEAAVVTELDNKIVRRATHIPLAYIRGRSEFYGREFYVDERVLEPRPETETMVELLLSLPLPEQPVIIDVGTGSGALAITTKLELPSSTVYATDIDTGCLEVARRNSKTLNANVTLLQADLLAHREIPGRVDSLLANLPYVPNDFHINLAATHEPQLAIFGGPDGLDLYRRLFASVHASYVLTEALPSQHHALTKIAADNNYKLLKTQDFIQLFTPKPLELVQA